ncbi:hypothetical protein [Dyella flagellata]|uniref:Uncharacterized protein n=1 Tax=Dyella flagellata TaxID=1867833 RepID=A0ABQ5XEW2_9GAMM|nr:hypothetical protein [Dyella flagellata]GLQ88969.1 hypothetical protein GCM10007898_25400 [Dyella flagellata]
MDVRKTTLSDMGGPSQQEWKSGALGRHLSSIAVFFVSWCVTYSRVYVNGDDVVHMQGSYGKSIFLPSFKPDWIPNRVFDMYGRNLLVHLFDMIYFPVKSLFGVDFFLFF